MQALTLNDCKEILTKVNQQKDEIIDYQLKPISEKTRGYLGEHLKLSVNSRNGTTNFFVKSTKSTNELGACFENFFEKEVFAYKFFNSVKEKCGKVDLSFLPKYYHHTEDGALILENLEEDGFYGCDELKLGEDKVVLLLGKLAKMHAASFKFVDCKKELDGNYDLCKEYKFGPLFTRDNNDSFNYISAGVRGAAYLVDLAGRDKSAKELIFDYKEKFLDLIVEENNFAKVFCHGDLWSYNVLFKNNGGKTIDCKLIDYQLITYAPPALDVTMLIYHIGDRQVQKITNKLYKIYYEYLREELSRLELNISTILSYDDLLKSCKLFMPWSKYLWMLYRQSSQAKDQVWRDLAKTPEKSKQIIMGPLREAFVEENFRTNQDYREVLTTILDDNILTQKNPLINIEDLYELISGVIKNSDFEINDIKLKELGERQGYLGEHFILDIQITCNSNVETHNFFIKFTPFIQVSRDFANQTGASYKEVKFFNTLLQLFQDFNLPLQEILPKVYLATDDYIIFENLNRRNYHKQNPRFSVNYNKMIASLRSLAKLHAFAIIFEQKFGKGRLDAFFPLEFREIFYTDRVELTMRLLQTHAESIQFLVETLSNNSSVITKEEFSKIGKNIILDFPNLVKPSNKYINTICHADLWGSNLMFKGDDDCILIDFQSYRYSPPTHDLMQIIYLTSNTEERQKHMQDYLKFYYEQFGKVFEDYNLDVNDYLNFEDFLESCKEEEVLAVAQTVTHFQTVLLSKENKEVVFKTSDSCDRFFFGDLRESYLKEFIENDQEHKERLEEAIRDFRRICEENKDKYLL